ncbi:MAG: outer membrane protein assembly factor BamD [Bacteroidales bacterium]|nr:outer membrane protein assembly factor BamD [Bacteroidales bacterium]
MKYKIIYIAGLVLILSSCSKYQRLLKSTDYDLKYSKAVEYYEDKDYYRSLTLFEEMYPYWKCQEKGEQIYYYIAYSHYGQGDFILAGYHFRNFARTYPRGKHLEECSYMAAYCYYLDSPEASLDQTYTISAIEELQSFINKFPESDKVDKCNELILTLRKKLELKSYMAAKLYFDIGYYKAAVTALKNSIKDFPDSDYREEILFMIVKSNYLFAENSIESKQVERFRATVSEYQSLVDEFPSSKYQKEAEKYYDKSLKFLENIK